MTFFQQFHRFTGPHRPVPKQTTDNPPLNSPPMLLEAEWGDEIQDDVVVIPRVKRDILSSGSGYSPDHIDCLISIERRNLDGDHILDLRKTAPEGIRQNATAYRWLMV